MLTRTVVVVKINREKNLDAGKIICQLAYRKKPGNNIARRNTFGVKTNIKQCSQELFFQRNQKFLEFAEQVMPQSIVENNTAIRWH